MLRRSADWFAYLCLLCSGSRLRSRCWLWCAQKSCTSCQFLTCLASAAAAEAPTEACCCRYLLFHIHYIPCMGRLPLRWHARQQRAGAVRPSAWERHLSCVGPAESVQRTRLLAERWSVCSSTLPAAPLRPDLLPRTSYRTGVHHFPAIRACLRSKLDRTSALDAAFAFARKLGNMRPRRASSVAALVAAALTHVVLSSW